MTLDPVMLAITEDALAELAITYTRHQSLMNQQTAGPTRQGRRDSSVADTTTTDRAACWLRLVSITEIHAENLLRHLDDGTQDKPPANWGPVKTGLKDRHSIDVTLLDSYTPLEACFLVRNAIAHGLGRFTDNQLHPKKDGKRTELRRPLRSIGVHLRDGAVVITPAALTICRDTCRAFITTLDNRRPRTTPPRDATEEARTQQGIR
jgi:hypothetical protein